MTRTTELLKGCEEEFEYTNDYAPHYIKCGNRFANTGIILCPSCKSELRGRLDALKEEETYLIQFEKDFQCITPILIGEEIEDRLASIRKEIKLIEDTIKT